MEETEALVSIDVNTGSHKGNRKDGKTSYYRQILNLQSKWPDKCG